jgi:hypothetical protein
MPNLEGQELEDPVSFSVPLIYVRARIVGCRTPPSLCFLFPFEKAGSHYRVALLTPED